jgi:hypothetical protein
MQVGQVACRQDHFISAADRVTLVNKQLNDKERVAAALENPHLLSTLEQCLATVDRRDSPAD